MATARRVRRKKLFLETLEDRRLLATLVWQGTDNGNWSEPNNWSPAQAPQAANNDVLIFDTNTSGVGNFTNTNNIPGLTDIEIQIVDDDAVNNFDISGNRIELAANGITQTGSAVGTNSISTPLTLAAPTTVTNANANGGSVLSLEGDIDNAGHLLTFGGARVIFYSGVLSGAGGVTVDGGAVFFNGANTYDGVTTVNASAFLFLESDGELGSTMGNTIVNAGGVLSLANSPSVLPEPLTLDGGILFAQNSLATFPGPITLASDSTLDSLFADLTVTGPITGVGGFTTTGADIVTLTNTNNYTGTTNVDNGTLLVNGSTAAASTVNVDNATLGGTGNVQGPVNVNNGGTLSPGVTGPGILMTGDLDLMDSANFDIEINDPGVTPGVDYDQTQVMGTVRIGNANFNLSGGRTPVVGEQYIVIANDLTDPVMRGANAPVEGAVVGILNGVPLRITYSGGDGNDVVLQAIALSSIHGYKFDDVDGNGMFDQLIDMPLAGVTFTLTGTDSQGTVINTTAMTGANGEFEFTALLPSVNGVGPQTGYTVTETVPTGFVATTPTTFISDLMEGVELVAFTDQAMIPQGDPRMEMVVGAALMFGNTVYGSIHGYKFDDVDGNGMFDPMIDLPLPGVEFTLTGTDGMGNMINVSAQTNAMGEFWFTDLPPSDGNGYTVTETVPMGFVPTTPTTFTSILTSREELVAFAGQAQIQPGDPRMEVLVGAPLMFGNTVYGSIHGYKFEDRDGNGMFDPMVDLPLPGVEFTLTGTDGQGNMINTTETSDANGEFWFVDLVPSVDGTPTPMQGINATGYTVTEVVPPGFTATTPTMFTRDLRSRQELVAFAGQAMLDTTPQVDQQQLIISDNVASVMGSEFEAQNFVPGIGGELASVAIQVDTVAGAGDVTMSIQTTTPTGEPSGVVLGEVTIPAASVPIGTDQTLTFDFSVASLVLVPGQTYSIVLSAPTSPVFIDWLLADTGNPYLAGSSFSSPDSGMTWQEFPDSDAVFTTNMVSELRREVLVGAPLMFGNTYPGSIHGYKFIDVNGNGVFDPIVDTPQQDVTFTLTGTDGLGNMINVPPQTTNVNGQFWFMGLPPSVNGQGMGTGYTLTETVPSGFFATGMNPRQFDLFSGQELVWLAGAAMLPTPMLDQNQPLFNQQTAPATGTLFTAQSFMSGVSGRLTEVDLRVTVTAPVGNVILEVQTLNASGVPSGLVVGRVTIPGANVPVGISQVLNFDFTAAPATAPFLLAGSSYALVLSSPTSAAGAFIWDSTMTDTYPGGETLGSVDSGLTWTAFPMEDQTFVTTMQAGERFEVLVGDADRDGFGEQLMFGNTPIIPGSIHGHKFEDLNGDGVEDAGEPRLNEWQITLTDLAGNPVTDAFGNPVVPVMTMEMDLNGDMIIDPLTEMGLYWFTDLLPGTYVVRETAQPGFIQTTHNPQPLTITDRGEEYVGLSGQAMLAPDDRRVEIVDKCLIFGNVLSGSIHGFKFEDLDADGLYEPEDGDRPWAADPALPQVTFPAVTFELRNAQGAVVGTQTIDPANPMGGQFWFTNLLPGVYTVTELQPIADHVMASWNPSPATITVSSGQEHVWNAGAAMLVPGQVEVRQDGDDDPTMIPQQNDLMFGNYVKGSIHGFKFQDLDRDGVYEPANGEKPVAGIRFELTGMLAGGITISRNTLTNAEGEFWFENLQPGQYTVTEVLGPASMSTTGMSQTFTIRSREELVWRQGAAMLDPGDLRQEIFMDENQNGFDERLMWGNIWFSSIHGHKFEDIDGDGVEDPGEPRLNDWTITLRNADGSRVVDASGNEVPDVVTTTMDLNGDGMISATENGLYWFENLLPGTYFVREVLQDGWVQTTHDPSPISITGGQIYVAQRDQVKPTANQMHTIIVDKCLAFGNLRGEVSWVKHNKRGELLGGVIFVVTRTHSYDHLTDQFTDILDEPITVQDNLSRDVDLDFGEFRVLGLLPGRYTLAESVPVPGYDPDNFVETFEITRRPNNVYVAEHTWVNTWSKRAFVGSTFALRLDYLASIGLSEPPLNGQPVPVVNGVAPAAEGPPIAAPAPQALPEAEPEAVSEVATNPNETESGNAEAEGDVGELIDGSNVPTAGQSPWQNANNRFDVDDDGSVTPLDALIGINLLEAGAVGAVPEAESGSALHYYDVNGDGQLSPLDVLQIMNYLDPGPVEAEGEAAPADRASQDAARDLIIADYDDLNVFDQADEMIAGIIGPAKPAESPFSRYDERGPEDEDDDLESILSGLG